MTGRAMKHPAVRRLLDRRQHHPDFDRLASQGWRAVDAEAKLPVGGWKREQARALALGLPGADSLTDRRGREIGLDQFLCDAIEQAGNDHAARIGDPGR
jgi:hypothetical protein